jgi:Protein of unknown function (DUF1757)
MSRFFPHAVYAEDQALSKTILTTHVLSRAFQAGSLVGTGVGLSVLTLRRLNVLSSRIAPLPAYLTVLRSSGTGAVIALGILSVALPIRMSGREEIEWQDRAWRLRANKGQTECDDYTYAGMAAATAAVAWKGKGLGWRGAIGGIGAGSVVGMLSYMGWRYGVKGGKFEEDTTP